MRREGEEGKGIEVPVGLNCVRINAHTRIGFNGKEIKVQGFPSPWVNISIRYLSSGTVTLIKYKSGNKEGEGRARR